MKVFKTSWHNIRRSPYQAIAAILVMSLIFLLISYFAYVLLVSSKTLSFFETKPAVTAFFRNDIKQEDVNALENQFRGNNKVASVKFVSKEQALKIYKEQNKSDPLLLDLVTADILPASLEVSTLKIQDLPEIYNILKGSTLIENVIYQKDAVSDFTVWIRILRETGLGIITILSVVSVLIIVMLIGMKVSQKKEDIEIMRLVGAGGWYVRWPFIFEGMFYGAIGAVVGWALASAYVWYRPPFPPFMQDIFVSMRSPIFLLGFLGAEVLLAIILGMLASFLAVFRYLK